MHIYQKDILDKLRLNDKLRYSQLQPDGVESSHFKYHLDQLIKEGLVAQAERGIYHLTPEGQATVDRLSEHKVNPEKTPKVITYTLLQRGPYYYLQRKTKEPYRGLINMIGGKVHVGESTRQAAVREVHEKTGLEIAEPILRGIAEIRIRRDGQLLSHAVAYVYVADLDSKPQSGKLQEFMANTLHQQIELAPDLLAIIRELETKTAPFTADIDIEW